MYFKYRSFYKYILNISAKRINMIFSVNIICKQYTIPQCTHSLNVPVLYFVFSLIMVQRNSKSPNF